MEIVSWLNIITGIGLWIIAFFFGGIFLAITVDRKNNLGSFIVFVITIVLVLVGVYSVMTGLGLFLP